MTTTTLPAEPVPAPAEGDHPAARAAAAARRARARARGHRVDAAEVHGRAPVVRGCARLDVQPRSLRPAARGALRVAGRGVPDVRTLGRLRVDRLSVHTRAAVLVRARRVDRGPLRAHRQPQVPGRASGPLLDLRAGRRRPRHRAVDGVDRFGVAGARLRGQDARRAMGGPRRDRIGHPRVHPPRGRDRVREPDRQRPRGLERQLAPCRRARCRCDPLQAVGGDPVAGAARGRAAASTVASTRSTDTSSPSSSWRRSSSQRRRRRSRR